MELNKPQQQVVIDSSVGNSQGGPTELVEHKRLTGGLSRVRTRALLKALADASSFSSDVPELVSKVIEHVMTMILKDAVDVAVKDGREEVRYGDIAEVINKRECFKYLWEYVPRTTLVDKPEKENEKESAKVESVD